MGSIKQRNQEKRQRTKLRRYKRSILGICGVIVLMSVIVAVSSISLRAKNNKYKTQEIELQAQLKEEKLRAEEIEDLGKYVGTDAYIEDIAKDKLGLLYENEILFQPET